VAGGLDGGWEGVELDTSTLIGTDMAHPELAGVSLFRVCPGARSAELLLTTWMGMILSPEEGLEVVVCAAGCGR